MNKLISIILSVLIATLVISLGRVDHVLAMQSQPEMGIGSQGTITNYEEHCSNLHTNILATDDEESDNFKVKTKTDKEPQPPYFLQFVCSNIRIDMSVFTPTGRVGYGSKVPLYRLFSVIRR